MNTDKINPFKEKNFLQISVLILFALTIWLWHGISVADSGRNAVYFLDIGQGDAELITLASPSGGGGIKILNDTGRNRKILNALDGALGKMNDKYIDLIILSHEDADHSGGTIDVIKNYGIGAIIYNGRQADSDVFAELIKTASEKDIPLIVLLEGDSIRYGDAVLSIISPDDELLGEDSNEASIVFMLSLAHAKALFTGDIGWLAENILLKKGYELRADILKVGHHGSKKSSGDNFIANVRPAISGIGVGGNSYGHPAERVLNTLTLAGSKIFRTDRDGTIKIVLDEYFDFDENKNNTGGSIMARVGNIMTGDYKSSSMKIVSLPRAIEDRGDFKLTPFKECSFYEADGGLENPPIIFNEIAWMGAQTGYSHEWIELKNLSGKTIDMSGWQILNENEKIKFAFPQQAFFKNNFIILARASADEVLNLGADFIFTGAIRNSNEGLRLFDNNCNLIDKASGAPSWPAGDNKSKQTMARTSGLTWAASVSAGGTPGAPNSFLK